MALKSRSALPSPGGRGTMKKAGEGQDTVLRVKLIGANRAAQIAGVDPMQGKSNYFIGNDPKKWHTDVPNYAKVELKNVYPGIDLMYRGSTQEQLEYDFRLAPGADPNAIQLSFKGMKKLALDKDGNLIVGIGKSKLIEHAPVIYQEIGGKEQTVAGGWVLHGAHEAGFKLAAYDRTKPVVIDPVLLYSTYLGGSGGDVGHGIAVDSSGNAYITGWTTSPDFPIITNAFQGTYGGGSENVFVAKLNPSASGAESLAYSTYLGGSGNSNG
jgi:beta-propeller repeat-containing protein